MKIGIDINGVLRDTIGKFEQTYEKFLIEKNEEMDNLMTLELSGDTFDENSFEVLSLCFHHIFLAIQVVRSFLYRL